MTTIIGMSGSLRAGSMNSALLRAAQQLMPAGAQLEIATLKGIPLYDGDLESAQGVPAEVKQLQDRIAAADGLLLVSPEYNNGIPGVFKNGIDSLSRPPKDIPRVFGDRPTALMGATNGGFGTVLAQNAWWPVLRALGVRPWFGGRMAVARAAAMFDADMNLTDEATRQHLQKFLEGFLRFVRNEEAG